jgi:RNA polymerase sigma-70 factor, ECF subfamily
MRASLHHTDEELWRLALAGDEQAFTLFYRRRQGAVYRFAWQMCGSESVAEDVTQEVFMALVCEGARYDPARGPIAAYLYGIARRQVLRRLAKDRAFVELPGDEAGATDERLLATHDPLGELTRRETVEVVRQAVLALPTHYREVVVLCDLHELSYAEAAEVLACALGTVRSRLARARLMLGERLRSLRPRAEAEVAAKRCCA